MAFPYSFSKQTIFNKDEYKGITAEMIRFGLLNAYANDEFIEENDCCLVFKSNYSLVNFSYKISIAISENDTEVRLNTKFHLVELLKIIVLLVVFIALFSKFAFNHFLLFSGIFVAVFYLANVIFISSAYNSKLKKSLKFLGLHTDNDISAEQRKWLNSPELCSACGTKLNKNDLFCPECGLRIKQNPYTKDLDFNNTKSQKQTTSQQNDIKINYQYKENNDKTN